MWYFSDIGDTKIQKRLCVMKYNFFKIELTFLTLYSNSHIYF